MSKTAQRFISTSFWSDPFVFSLSGTAKYLYLYLMTNEMTNIAGVYEIMIPRMAFDTGLEEKEVSKILDKLESEKKVFYSDNWMIIPTWPKHQRWEKSSKIKLGIINILQDIPDKIFDLLTQADYKFDLDLVDKVCITSKNRDIISGSTEKRVKERAEGVCETCKTTENLSIYRVNEKGGNGYKNLILSCPQCIHKETSPDTLSQVESQSICSLNYKDIDLDKDRDKDIDIDTKLTTNDVIEKWNSCGLFTPCNYTEETIPHRKVINGIVSQRGKSILCAIENLSEMWHEIEPKYRPTECHKFLLNSVGSWANNAKPHPYERFGKERTLDDDTIQLQCIEIHNKDPDSWKKYLDKYGSSRTALSVYRRHNQ